MYKRLAGSLACVLAGGLIATGSAWADGAVYGMTNQLGTNQVVAYHRASDGTLTLMQTIGTGGGGSGVQLSPPDSLGSQGSLLVDRRNGRLFAVNTNSTAEDSGSDATEVGDCAGGSISSFKIRPNGMLTFVGSVDSGGLFPASLTIDQNLLYVLNAGGPGVNPVCGTGPNITGFNVAKGGQMTPTGAAAPIDPGTSPSSFQNCDPGGFPSNGEFDCGLNPPAFPRSPAQVGFSPDGSRLVVTVKGTNTIYVFPVRNDGTPGTPTKTVDDGTGQPTPFGFAFTKTGASKTRKLIVTEPFGSSPTIPAPGAGALSSFAIGSGGSLRAISSHVANGGTASCWIAVEPSGTYAYVSNNGSNSISSYAIGANGSLTLLNGTAAASVNGPNDLVTVSDETSGSTFLYALASGAGALAGFRVNSDGSLTAINSAGSLPADAGATGIAGY